MNELSLAADVIEDLIVDDYYGLWEVLYTLEPRFPGKNRAEVLEIAERALTRLIDADRAELFRGTAYAGEEQPISKKESSRALRDWSWEPGSSEEHLRVTISEQRAKELRSH